MKMMKRTLSRLLIMIMVLSVLPIGVFGTELQNQLSDEYTISNGYLTYTYNKKTGGFAIFTDEGHPQKSGDNDMPLLYKEDENRSNGTSFVSVRISKNGEYDDFIFGQDYTWAGYDTAVGEPVVSNEGKLITIPWTIEGVTVTKKIAIGTDENTDIIGNAGIGFEIHNDRSEQISVGVRLLLDTALGNMVDAPYIIAGNSVSPTTVETEFVDKNMPDQVRTVDSLNNPTKMSYIISKGWSGGIEPNKMVIGHWANIANTRYDYTPDTYCDFTNYSGAQSVPDSAVALYWEHSLWMGQDVYFETLYGIGNFSKSSMGDKVNLNVTAERVETVGTPIRYKNDGKIKVVVEIDNTLDSSVDLNGAILTLTHSEKDFVQEAGIYPQYITFNSLPKGKIQRAEFTIQAVPQSEITAGEIYANLTANNAVTGEIVDAMAERSIIIPSIKGMPADLQMNVISPATVYTLEKKHITISGNMKRFAALEGVDGWDMYMVHTDKNKNPDIYKDILINKEDIMPLDLNYSSLSFTTEEELTMGNYKIEFRFTDKELIDAFGEKITSTATVAANPDPIYKVPVYGVIAMVRITEPNDSTSDYDFFTFVNQAEYDSFYRGELSKRGEINGYTVQHNFGEDMRSIMSYEILLTVKGKIVKNQTGSEPYWTADPEYGVLINNMLEYKGSQPLKILRDGGFYGVEGQGKTNVVDSITVWVGDWDIKATKGVFHTLNPDRSKYGAPGQNTVPLTMRLGSVGMMVQSIGGFLMDLKYGELNSFWHQESDGRVTYGISFGGSISLPFSSKSNGTNDKMTGDDDPDPRTLVTQGDDDDYNYSFSDRDNQYMIADDNGNVDDDWNKRLDGADDLEQRDHATRQNTNDKVDNNNGRTNRTSRGLPEGQISAELRDVRFGEIGSVDPETGEVKVDKTGFIGIDATFAAQLPSNMLGSVINNVGGVHASVTINTIKNIYELNAGISIKLVECEGTFALKETTINGKQKIIPDKIEFYVRDGLRIPIAPPVLYLAGLGGGVNGLADTVGENFKKLPPLTVLAYMKLDAIGLLEGEFNARLSAEEMSLTGQLMLRETPPDILLVSGGIYARWFEPWSLNLHGEVNLVKGIIQGGVSVTISDDYFYGYAYVAIVIPEDIPFVGGKELAKVEAAVCDEFVGCNVKIIGIKFGVIYYWGKGVDFAKNVNISAPGPRMASVYVDSKSQTGVTGYYGTNLRPLTVMTSGGISLLAGEDKELIITVPPETENQDALLFEIQYNGNAIPEPNGENANFSFYMPGSTQAFKLVPDDGNGGGNYTVQDRGAYGKSIFITVTDPNQIKQGQWKLKYRSSELTLGTVKVDGVDNITELTGVSVSRGTDNASYEFTANWTANRADYRNATAMDIYLTKDKNAINNVKTDNVGKEGLGINVLHLDKMDDIKKGTALITLPEGFESGEYYVVGMLSTMQGANCHMTSTPIKFENPKLPVAVDGVNAMYGGDGTLYVEIQDAGEICDADGKVTGYNVPAERDYTHYMIEIQSNDDSYVSGSLDQFAKGDTDIYVGGSIVASETSNAEAVIENKSQVELKNGSKLIPGKKYKVLVRTLREETKDGMTKYFYGDDIVSSNDVEIPAPNKPVLESVTTTFDTAKEAISQNTGTITYTFDDYVYMELSVGGRRMTSANPIFRKDWTWTLEDLEDGDYIIDWSAISMTKDSAKGSDFADTIKNSQMGFSIDTSAPMLSLTQKEYDSLKQENDNPIKGQIGSNVVIADQNGTYVIEGITGADNIITVDGATEGITRDLEGIFKYTGVIPDNKLSLQHTIQSEDKAGNVSRVKVTVVSGKSTAIDHIELLADGKEAEKDSNGEAQLKMSDDQSIKITAVGVTTDGRRVEIPQENMEISLLYGEETAVLRGDTITPVSQGEAAVKVKLLSGLESTVNGQVSKLAFEDYAIITISGDTSVQPGQNPGGSGTGGGGGGGTPNYTITSTNNGNGKVELSQTKVKKGNSITITAIPDDGFEVYDMRINGESVGNKTSYTISAVNENISVEVIFRKIGERAPWNPFADVTEADWFYYVVKKVYEEGLMKGTSETAFEPDANVTRGMFVTVLHRMEGEPDAGESIFADVPKGEYYEKPVAWANENGIVLGISETEYAPDDNITREQMAAILYRYAVYKGYDVSVAESTNILSFIDADDISEYAILPMQWAVGSKVMEGKGNGILDPQGFATRAESAAVLTRMP